MNVKLPLVMLSIGDFARDRRLLAVVGPDGDTILPMFTDPEMAEEYRLWQSRNLLDCTLPVSSTGQDTNPPELRALLVENRAQLSDVLTVIMLVGRVTLIALNPEANAVARCLCLDAEELLEAVVD